VVLVAGQAITSGTELDQLAVDPGAGESLLRELLEHPFVLALAAPHDGGQHLEAGALG
jgi:hypothetical protein